jgi:hypothetical protein
LLPEVFETSRMACGFEERLKGEEGLVRREWSLDR